MELVKLNPPNTIWEKEVQADMVSMLEDWLEQAKSGNFGGMAICGVLKSGEVQTNVSQHNQHPALVGAVAILQTRLMRLVDPIVVD